MKATSFALNLLPLFVTGALAACRQIENAVGDALTGWETCGWAAEGGISCEDLEVHFGFVGNGISITTGGQAVTVKHTSHDEVGSFNTYYYACDAGTEGETRLLPQGQATANLYAVAGLN